MAQIRTTIPDALHYDQIYRTVLAAYEGLGYPPSVVNTWAIGPHDAPDLLAIAQKSKPEKILEVGTYVGVSTMLMALACPRARIYTVDPDLPLEIEMGATGSSIANVDATATTHAIARAAAEKLGIGDRIEFVKGGFSVRETFSSTLTSKGTKAKLAGPKLCKEQGPFDFVFIDGLHTAEAVAGDLELATKHLTPSGIAALHDCVGFWGANVRAGVLEFLRRNPSHRFIHPPYADLWRSVGLVAPAGSKALDRNAFAGPVSQGEQSPALAETFGAMLATSFGARDVLEVSVGAPLLKEDGVAGRYVPVRVLGSRAGQNLNAELDRILTQFDKLETPILFSADLLDFSPSELIQNLLAAISYRKGALLLGVTPPGESTVAGPESRPAAWLIDIARAHRIAAYAPPSLDTEPARYSMLPEMRELGRNSRLASSVILAPRGGFIDAKRRRLVELTPTLAAEREQAELQRVHLAAGYRRFFNESNLKSELLATQDRDLRSQIEVAVEAAHREKAWREESFQSLNAQISEIGKKAMASGERVSTLSVEANEKNAMIADLSNRLAEASEQASKTQALAASLAAEVKARDATIAELASDLTHAQEAGEREKQWREESSASFNAQAARAAEASAQAEVRADALAAQLVAMTAELEAARASASQEKTWREQAAESFNAQRARLSDVAATAERAAAEAEARFDEVRRASNKREAVLRAQLEFSTELARIEGELRQEREHKLRKTLDDLAVSDRALEDARSSIDAVYQERLRQAETARMLATENQARLELNLARFQEEFREAEAREASLRVQMEASSEIMQDRLRVAESDLVRLQDELERERLQVTEGAKVQAEAQAYIRELGAQLVAAWDAAKLEGAEASEELAHMAERLEEARAVIEDYSARLVDVYHAMDAFDAFVTQGEASLETFEREALGITVSAQHSEQGPCLPIPEGLAPDDTAAEIERLRTRWQGVLARLGRSVEAGGDRIRSLEENMRATQADLVEKAATLEQQMSEQQAATDAKLRRAEVEFDRQISTVQEEARRQISEVEGKARQQIAETEAHSALKLTESKALFEAQLAELKGTLAARSAEGSDMVARIEELSGQNADLTQQLIDVYQAVEDIDSAVSEQLRLVAESEGQAAGTPADGAGSSADEDAHDHLIELRLRSRILSNKIASLLTAGEWSSSAADQAARNLEEQVRALEEQIAQMKGSTSWRVTGPVRAVGRPLRALRRRASAYRRGRALLKVKVALDKELAESGIQCPVFDAEAYARIYRDVPAEKALRHYLTFGEREGRWPMRNFDPNFYLMTYPDVRVSRQSPLLHFLAHGLREGRSPCAVLHPLERLAADQGMTPLELFARS